MLRWRNGRRWRLRISWPEKAVRVRLPLEAQTNSMQMKSLDVQIGGSHYHDKFKVQPIQLIVDCGWNFIQGNIAKYALRFPFKNGKQDLEKAIHYSELGDDLLSSQFIENFNNRAIRDFCETNHLDDNIELLLYNIDAMAWIGCKDILERLIREHYSLESQN